MLGYEFYRIDSATGRPVEFLLDPSPDAVRNYWAKLEDLAYDIHELLKMLRAGRETAPREPTATVFVAETTSDLHGRTRSDLPRSPPARLPRAPRPAAAAARRRDRDRRLELPGPIREIGRAHV